MQFRRIFFVLFVLFAVQFASKRATVLFFVSLLPDGDATSSPCSLVDVRVVQFSGDWLVRAVHYWDPMHFVLSGKGGTQYEYGYETAHSEISAKALPKKYTFVL